jgi:ATP-dependent DNA helicase RecG
MNITKGGIPTITGLLCFGFLPQLVFPQLCIIATQIVGRCIEDTYNSEELFIANERINGTIVEMLENAMNFVKRNARSIVAFGSDGMRMHKDEYPLNVVR